MKYLVLWYFPVRGRDPEGDRFGKTRVLGSMSFHANILGIRREYQAELTARDVCAGSVIIRERNVSQAGNERDPSKESPYQYNGRPC